MYNSDFCLGELFCPDITVNWEPVKIDDNEYFLQWKFYEYKIRLSRKEWHALKYFTGKMTVNEVQLKCREQPGFEITEDDFVLNLLTRLWELGVLESNEKYILRLLRPRIRWSFHLEDGYWILGNRSGLRHMQVTPQDKPIIDAIIDCVDKGDSELSENSIYRMITSYFSELHCEQKRFQDLFHSLRAIEIITESRYRKDSFQKKAFSFNPLSFICFSQPLFNPDRMLEQPAEKLRWLLHQRAKTISILFWGFLPLFLGFSLLFISAQWPELKFFNEQLSNILGWKLVFLILVMSLAVVTLHELAHALTLKCFGGAVSEVGLLVFFCLIPAAYVNTSDAYHLDRKRRLLVIGSGAICQMTIAAASFWLWRFTVEYSWLNIASYVLLTASLLTIVLNLNPLIRFDGYYILSTVIGVRNLRSRAFRLYINMLLGRKKYHDECFWRLLIYAPACLLYLIFVVVRYFRLLQPTASQFPYMTSTVLIIVSTFVIPSLWNFLASRKF